MVEIVRGTLDVLGVPFVFSQARVLTSTAFVRKAKTYGYRLNSKDLEELNFLGLLVPFYRVENELHGDPVEVDPRDQSPLARYARDGRLRDPMLEARAVRRPYSIPDGVDDDWWDGFYYGFWQLLGIGHAINARELVKHRPLDSAPHTSYAEKLRTEHLLISVLSDRFLPNTLGRATYSGDMDRAGIVAARREVGASERLALTNVSAGELEAIAEHMLGHADAMDPMAGWWDLVRHAGYEGWSRMGGAPLEAVWWRVGAEVLLRAHEELASQGVVDPLPDLSLTPTVHHPLMDRVGRPPLAMSLERALARYGLSPHPRVLLVLEGESEVLYIGALLEALDLAGSHLVHLVKQGTSSDWPWQLVPVLVPRVGEPLHGRLLLDSMPTALMIAMDPEGRWKTQEDVDSRRAALQAKLVGLVEAQGGTLSQDELDVLIQARNWGEYSFELANFDDSELETALRNLAVRLELPGVAAPGWEGRLSAALAHAREGHYDVKVIFDRMRWPVLKAELAAELVPVLVAKLNGDEGGHSAQVPAIKLVRDVLETVRRLTGPGYSISPLL